MRDSTGLSNLSLPGGGGGIAPLGDRFQPDLVRGTGNYSVPLPCPQGSAGLQPRPALTYSTGSGNGPLGLGWRCDPLRIERRSDRGVPAYDAGDVFTIGGAELLVPVGGGRYRPRTDTQFWHIQRQPGDAGWVIRDGSGRTLRLGVSVASRETGPGGQVFAWSLEEETDAAGNAIRYEYRADGNRLYVGAIRWATFALEFAYESRPDVLRNARSGFVRSTGLRIASIDLSCSRSDPTLMRTWRLGYGQAANGASLLARIELSSGEGVERVAHPALDLSYTPFDVADARVDVVKSELPPPDLEAPGTQLVDLDGDGLPDVLQLTAASGLSWRNVGGGVLEGPFRLAALPSLVALTRESVALADLDGDGRADLFATDQPLSVVFHADGKGGFDPSPTVFAERPSVRLDAPDTRLTDLDGDGVTDLLWTGPNALVGFRHLPGIGWDTVVAPRIRDLDVFPDVSFGDRGVRTGDMTGDGLSDMVVLRSGEVSYWPSLGSASYAGRVDMADPPRLPPGYRESSLFLFDVDGDGCADVVYVGDEGTTVWLNRQGNGFAPPVVLPISPPPGRLALVADIFGDGRPGLVWSSSSRSAGDSGYRVLRFGAGAVAPNLLARIDNGMGGRSEIDYVSTTAMRAEDALDGRPWTSFLPMPLHVVAAIRQIDTVTGRVQTTRMRYHDGVYDGRNREFRGFRTVTVDADDEDASIPASRQELTFFQGDPDEPDLVERARQRALAGSPTATAMYERTADGWLPRQRSEQAWTARLERDDGPLGSIWFPYTTRIDTREVGLAGPDRVESLQLLGIDAHGNATEQRRRSGADGDASIADVVSDETTTYLDDEANWLVRLPVRTMALDGDGVPFTVRITRYDGPAFEGLPEGAATAGQVTNVLEARIFDARTPDGLLDGQDPGALGYRRVEGDAAGWYAVTSSVRRDARGNVVEQRDPLGVPTLLAYDADGVFPVSATDPAGRVTQLVFEPRSGEPARIDYPDGRVARAAYDRLGRLVATSEIDDAGTEQLTKAWVTDTGSVPMSTTSFAPSRSGADRTALIAAADPLTLVGQGVSVSRAFHDGFGNRLATVATAPAAPGGAVRVALTDRVVLNSRGMVATRLPEAFAADLSWPGVPTASEVAAPGARHTRYGAGGEVTETIGPGPAHFFVARDSFTIEHREGGPDGTITRTEEFDPRGRLLAVAEVLGGGAVAVARYELDFDGRVRVLLDADGGEVARWTHAGPGDPVRIGHRDAGTRDYIRDAAGRLVEMRDADGTRLRYGFDASGRVVSVDAVTRGEGQPETVARIRTIAYDADPDPAHPSDGRFLAGRVAMIDEAGNIFRWSYDRAGRPVREEQVVAGVTEGVGRAYDLQGRLTALTYPDGTMVAYEIDPGGAVVAVQGFARDLDYAADGSLRSYLADNGMTVAMPRSEATGRLEAIRATAPGGAVLRSLGYEYDDTGSIVAMTDVGSTGTEFSAFDYDGAHRLVAVSVRQDDAAGAVIRSHAYSYDGAGNLVHYGDALVSDMTYGDAAHTGRVTDATGRGPVAYGPRGEVTACGPLSGMAYDAFARLVAATSTAGGGAPVSTRFAYDPRGRRVLKEVQSAAGTARTRSLAGLWEATDAATVRHVFLGAQLLASVTTPTAGAAIRLTHVCDHHGTVVASVDDAGVLAAWQRYSPFGAALQAGQALDRYLGREPDAELGLLQLGARFLDPALGRFLSPDWYILEHPDKAVRLPQGFAVYSYALNNPLSFKDPSGLWFGLDDLIVAAVGFVVGFVSGLVYGLANGQGWGSLMTALETGLTTSAGAWLGWTVAGPLGAVMGGMNGLIGGIHGIYDWSSPAGWFAFFSDSTWSLLGTSLGNVVHIINLFYKDANYREDLSRRQNRNVYEGGFALKKDFAFTQGNVISNAGQGTGSVNTSFIANHEELHVWQQRFFGPIFQVGYVVWAIGGAIVGTIVWFWHTDTGWSGLGSLIETAAYYDNPFEYWAYKNDNNWPPSGANPTLTY